MVIFHGYVSLPEGMLTDWWFGTWLLFFHILEIIISTDFHIFIYFFRRGRSTTNQLIFMAVLMDNDMYNSIIKNKVNMRS